MIKFTKNISCENAQECTNNISKKLKILLADNSVGVNYHTSIYHQNQNHQFWVFLYDKNGIHESQNTITKEIVKQKSDKVKKFKGTLPTESEIKKAI